jgi:hypothetical protein
MDERATPHHMGALAGGKGLLLTFALCHSCSLVPVPVPLCCQLVLVLHPDKNPAPGAKAAFEAVKAAHTVLAGDGSRQSRTGAQSQPGWGLLCSHAHTAGHHPWLILM